MYYYLSLLLTRSTMQIVLSLSTYLHLNSYGIGAKRRLILHTDRDTNWTHLSLSKEFSSIPAKIQNAVRPNLSNYLCFLASWIMLSSWSCFRNIPWSARSNDSAATCNACSTLYGKWSTSIVGEKYISARSFGSVHRSLYFFVLWLIPQETIHLARVEKGQQGTLSNFAEILTMRKIRPGKVIRTRCRTDCLDLNCSNLE